MMENEKKSTVGGLFAMDKSADKVSYYQQAAASTESSDHYPKDDEDCVGGFSFGNNNPTSVAFAAAKPTKTSHLFSQPRRP